MTVIEDNKNILVGAGGRNKEQVRGRENFPRKKHGISRQESEKCEIQLRNFNFLERLGYRIPRRGKYEVSFRW